MSADQAINILVTITLIQLMVTIGLGVTFADVARVAANWGLLARAALANYVLVPAATVGLLSLFQAPPLVAAGFLVAAVCPGAPYGPPFAAMAKGNVPVSIGLMVLLAARLKLIVAAGALAPSACSCCATQSSASPSETMLEPWSFVGFPLESKNPSKSAVVLTVTLRASASRMARPSGSRRAAPMYSVAPRLMRSTDTSIDSGSNWAIPAMQSPW